MIVIEMSDEKSRISDQDAREMLRQLLIAVARRPRLSCPDETRNLLDLAALSDGTLRQDGLRRYAAHLLTCGRCAELAAVALEDERRPDG